MQSRFRSGFLPGASILAAGLSVFGVADVSAQAVPGSVEPGRVERGLKEPPAPRSQPRPVVPLVADQLAPKDAAGVTFRFERLVIEGNGSMPTRALAGLWKHRPGDQVSIDEVFALANEMTRLYSESGYVLCFAVVPKQEIKDGVVRIAIVEGFVSAIDLSGPPPGGLAGRAAAAQATRIRLDVPLRSAVLERSLLLMDDLPGWSATAVLNPDPRVLGGSALAVRFAPEPWSAEASWSSFLPKGLGRSVLGANLSVFDLADASDQLSVGLYASPGSNAYRSASLGYNLLAGTDGQRLGLSFSQSDSRPQDAVLLPLEYRGISRNTRLTYTYPLRRNRASTINLEAFLGALESTSSMSTGTPTCDRLRTAGLSLDFDFASEDRSTTLVRLGVEQGFRGLGATGNSRENGRIDFTALTIDWTRNAPIGSLGSGMFSYSLAAQGQGSLAGSMLSPSESSFGGRQFGRFFDSGSMSGEHGLYASLELRYGAPIPVGLAEPVGTQLFAFVDGGVVRQRGGLQPQEVRQRHASSVGFGVRLGLPAGMNALVEFSHPVSVPEGYTGDRGERINGSFGVRF